MAQEEDSFVVSRDNHGDPQEADRIVPRRIGPGEAVSEDGGKLLSHPPFVAAVVGHVEGRLAADAYDLLGGEADIRLAAAVQRAMELLVEAVHRFEAGEDRWAEAVDAKLIERIGGPKRQSPAVGVGRLLHHAHLLVRSARLSKSMTSLGLS